MKKILLIIFILLCLNNVRAFQGNSSNYSIDISNTNYGAYNANNSSVNLDFSLIDQPTGDVGGDSYSAHLGFYGYFSSLEWIFEYPISQIAAFMLAWFIVPIGLFTRRKWLIYLAGCFLLVVGTWLMINGFSFLQDWLTRSLAFASIGTGLGLILTVWLKKDEEVEESG
jgi:hypothetical protein